MEQNKSITIDNITYYPISQIDYEKCYDAFDIVHFLKPNEYAIFYDKYIYKTHNNEYRASYIDDTSNNWSI